MTGTAIAAEVHSALLEAAQAVGQGEYTATISRASGGPTAPHEVGSETVTTYTARALDLGTKDRYDAGMQTTRKVRTLMLSAITEAPLKSDKITLPDGEYEIEAVMPYQPAGDVLFFKVEIEG